MKTEGEIAAGAVVVIAPDAKDAALVTEVLSRAGINTLVCDDFKAATDRLGSGTNALLIAEEALTSEGVEILMATLAKQPAWSDLSLILLTTSASEEASERLLNLFGSEANVTLLERPLHGLTLITAVRAALRGRRRQYQMRDLLEQRETALSSITDAFAALDREWRYIYVNATAARFAGLRREEMIGRSIWEIYPEAVGGNFYRHMHRAVETQQPQSFEQFYERWNCWLETRIYPASDGVVVFRADINERKANEQLVGEAERKVHESEAVLRLALDAAGAGTFDYQSRPRELRLGQRAKQLFGFPPDAEVNRRTLIPLLHPEDRASAVRALRYGLRAGGEPFTVEFRILRPDGAERWISATGRAFSTAPDNSERCIGTLLDVTERKLSEQKLRHALDTLNATLAGMSDAFLVYDRDFRIVNANPAAAEIARKPFNEMFGRSLWELYPELRGSEFEANYRRSMEQRVPVQFEFYDAAFNRWYESRCQPVPQGLAVFLADVTERRHAREALEKSAAQLRFVTDHATTIMLGHCDGEGRYLFVNEPYARRFGIPRDKILGRKISDVVGDVAYAVIAPHVDAALRGERVDFELEIPYAEGTRWISASYIPEKDADGRVRGCVAVMQDTTERKKAEIALERAKLAAEEANRAKDQFLAMVSHELRTPLTPVLMTVAALQRDPSIDDALRADIDIIQRNIELEALLIDDLLDLTRVAHGKLELHHDAVDVHALIDHALGISAAEIEAKQLRIIRRENAVEHHCWADAARLQQVLWNLIKNAVKFTPEHGEVRIDTRNDNAHRIVIEIADTGIGIEPELLPRLFHAFEQGGRAVTNRYGGLGLGLAISKSIIDLHNGSIVARSAGRGHGASFTITLQAIATSLLGAPVYALDRPVRTGAPRILLVEDHEDTARVLHRMLERAGYCVALAQSISAARERASREQFDLLISDVGLPDGSGLDLMRELRADQRLAGIALSGFGSEEDTGASRAAGFAEHLTKPVDWERLRESIERVTRRLERDELSPA